MSMTKAMMGPCSDCSSHLCSFSRACSIMLTTSTLVSRTRVDCSCALLWALRLLLRPAEGWSSWDWRAVTCQVVVVWLGISLGREQSER